MSRWTSTWPVYFERPRAHRKLVARHAVLRQQVLAQVREHGFFGRRSSLAGSAEARKALAGVRVERDFAHFTVANDVDTSLHLPGGDIQHGLPHALFEFLRRRLSVEVRPQRGEQRRRAGQAAGMGGEDAILTRLHTRDFAAGCSARMRCRISRPHNERGMPTSCDDCHTTSSISAGVAPSTSALRM